MKSIVNAASWLDSVQPGWFAQIDTETLRMTNCIQCIIGQLCGKIFPNECIKWLVTRGVSPQEAALSIMNSEYAFGPSQEAIPYWLNEIYTRRNA